MIDIISKMRATARNKTKNVNSPNELIYRKSFRRGPKVIEKSRNFVAYASHQKVNKQNFFKNIKLLHLYYLGNVIILHEKNILLWPNQLSITFQIRPTSILHIIMYY